ncbi:MAG: phage holin family protein [Solirubrobacteraceae bacterium]
MASDDQGKLAEALHEITERATLIVREEIELARVEIEVKVKSLVRGAVVGAAAGFFALMGLIFLLHGISWFFYLNVFDDPFWGFLIVAGLLFVGGALAGWLAAKAFKAGAPPKPEMAIDEAKLIRETVEASAGFGDGAPAQPPAGVGAAVPARSSETGGAVSGGDER